VTQEMWFMRTVPTGKVINVLRCKLSKNISYLVEQIFVFFSSDNFYTAKYKYFWSDPAQHFESRGTIYSYFEIGL